MTLNIVSNINQQRQSIASKVAMSDEQRDAITNASVSMQEIEYENKIKKAEKMSKGFGDISIFDDKKVSNIKEHIQMTIIDGKIGVLNNVTFDLVENEEDVAENSFFANADSKEDVIKGSIYILKDDKGECFQSPNTKWLTGKENVNLEVFPEEMIEVISKSIKSNQGIAKSFENDNVVRFGDGLNAFPSDFDSAIANTEKAHVELMSQIKKFKSLNGSVNIEDFLDRYFFKKHLLIQGEKGGGKTYSVDKLLRDRSIDSELIIGHEGIEAIDMLGYYVKTDTGELVWLDGALTKAFRKAVDGEVALFIDEMLRIPTRELNILVGSLTPSSAGTYRLRTNRVVNVVDGVGETELIEIPMANLWCIGTTNVGAGYQVDEIDDALADRFRVVNKTTSNSELESILNSCADSVGINRDIVPKMVEFYTQMKDLVVSGELEKNVNTRHLCEALQLSNETAEVKTYMIDLIPTWTSQDTNGQPNKAERDIINKLLKKIMK